jgi:prepilin-type N-terminal cleavage/methylation domain-containing protein/prepilin-type processing-associated H-X9-DG protein
MKPDGHPAPNVSRFHSSGHAPGFTLIELLVVIAIIALLAALAFPLIEKMQTGASQTKAAANFRQLGAAIMSYAADNNQQLPGPLSQMNKSSTSSSIGVRLYEQIGIPKPTSANEKPLSLLTVPALKKWKYAKGVLYPAAYTVIRNAPLPDGSEIYPFGLGGAFYTEPAKLFQVPNPSKTWAIYEAGGSGDPRSHNRRDIPDGPIHGKWRTVLFIDGHVETVPSDVIPEGSENWF